MPIVVLLGTGTNVGKTYVAVQLARALERQCPDAVVVAVKPVESGFSPEGPSDARALEAASRGAPLPSPHPLYRFEAHVAPHLAARRAQLEAPDVDRIRSWLMNWYDVTSHRLSRQIWLIVETAGGVFSPLANLTTNADLALILEPSLWVLVAPDALGVLHDVTTTLATLALRARAPDALVLSASREADSSTGSNADELRGLGIADPVADVARGSSDLSQLARALIERAKARSL